VPRTTVESRTRLERFAARVEAATPPDRDRSLDAFRAIAIAGVVVGHWLVGALVLHPDGALVIYSPLRTIEALAPASWLLHTVGLFFLVGGYAASRSLDRASARGIAYAAWLEQRLVRLGRPVVAVLAVSAGAVGALTLLGAPTGTLRVLVVLVAQPLWFVLVYGIATALTHLAVAADHRFGAWAALTLAAVVAVGDLLRYGPWQDVVPTWIGAVNFVPGWLFGYQLGIAWANGRLRRAGWAVLGLGAATFAVLLLELGYPASMVGVPGADRSNTYPPSLMLVALAAIQAGAAILLSERVARLMRRTSLWALVAAVNIAALTIFCWHQVPLVLVSLAGAALDGVQGLNDKPTYAAWVLIRLPWLAVMTGVLVTVVMWARRFERPWTGLRAPQRVLVGMLVAVFAGYVVALY